MTKDSTPSLAAYVVAKSYAESAARAAHCKSYDLLGAAERAQVLAKIDPGHRASIEAFEAVNPGIDAAARQIADGSPRPPGGLKLVDTLAEAREARDAEERKAYDAMGPAATALRIARGDTLPSQSDAIARRVAGLQD